jgi:hypothetical protein
MMSGASSNPPVARDLAHSGKLAGLPAIRLPRRPFRARAAASGAILAYERQDVIKSILKGSKSISNPRSLGVADLQQPLQVSEAIK